MSIKTSNKSFHLTANALGLKKESVMKWYIEVLKKYAVFKGRASREEYWMFMLFNFIVAFIIGLIERLLGSSGIIGNLYTLAIFIPGISVGVRRLHDTDHNGWWTIVPIIGFVFMFFKGHEKENRFGNNPQKLETTQQIIPPDC